MGTALQGYRSVLREPIAPVSKATSRSLNDMSNLVLRLLLMPALLFAAASCTLVQRPLSTATRADSTVIRRDIEFLASDRLEGRLAGTPGNDSAAA